MATFDAVFTPCENDATGTVTTAASSAEIAIAPNQIFYLIANGDANIRFGATGLAAATANNFYLPAKTGARYDSGRTGLALRIFNPTGSTITWWIQNLAK